MSTAWIYRFYVFMPAGFMTEAKSLAKSAFPGGWAERRAFSVQCSSDGLSPITHWACNTVITDAIRVTLLTTFNNGNWNGVKFYRVSPVTLNLQVTNSNSALNKIGQKFLFTDALADLSLQRLSAPEAVEEDIEPPSEEEPDEEEI